MPIMADLAAKLDELIATVRAASSADLYLDTAGVAAVLGYSYLYTRNVIVARPDFPAPLRMGEGGHARWRRSAVMQWGKAHEGLMPGVRRRRPSTAGSTS